MKSFLFSSLALALSTQALADNTSNSFIEKSLENNLPELEALYLKLHQAP